MKSVSNVWSLRPSSLAMQLKVLANASFWSLFF
ncbi:MAG: hypothetical protein RLZZ568_366, partial [Cyanobacteriota bacterium]